MTEFKPCTHDWIMGQDLKAIERLFPFGAKQVGKKWAPAQSRKDADKTLGQLKRDKRARMEKPRYLMEGSPRPRFKWDEKAKHWVEDDEGWAEGEEHGYTAQGFKAMRGEAEPVDDVALERFTKEAHAKEDTRRQVMRSRLNRLRELGIRQIKEGKEPLPEVEEWLQDQDEAA